MAAEVCLLLMQSLTGQCDRPAIAPETLPATVTASPTDLTRDAATVSDAIAPVTTAIAPQLSELCRDNLASRSTPCAVTTLAPATWQAPSPTAATATASQPVQGVAPAAATNSAIARPAPVELPTASRLRPTPAVPAPQFSLPTLVSAHPQPTVSLPSATLRPSNGPELYRQRQLALWSGRSYTRVAPSAYADRWRNFRHQPTYQEWQALLTQEARAIASGQGQNRLEVIVGDSFGLWLPPELLPRDRLWLNQSISGDTTAGILRRVSTFANTRATTIHLMAGTNDLKNGVPEAQIVNNLHQTVHRLRQQHPQARIVVYSVLPTRRADIGNDRVRSLNARIAQMTQQSTAEYRHIHHWFQDDGGHLRPDLTTDGLHLNPQGYVLWGQAIVARAL